MLSKRRGLSTAALVAGLALTAAACGGSSGGSTPGTTDSGAKKGGALKLLGGGDIDHMDPVSAYYQTSYVLLRAVTRQLLSYPVSKDEKAAVTPVADLATENAAPTNGGKTYTFKIRQGAMWDTTPPRQITGADAERGFKRLCNPVQPSGGIGYYVGVIVGMKEFCDPFAKVAPTAKAIGDYVEGHKISGITSTADSITINLIQPAGDFVNILAMPFDSPMPIEMNAYVPDDPSFRTHFISDGPYKITKYVAEKDIELVRNPAWKADTDPLRKAYVDSISIVQGSDEAQIQQQLQAATVDMSWDTTVPVANIPTLLQSKDPNTAKVGGGRVNYMVFNLLSPNNHGALKNVKVRQAIEYAVNKKAVNQVLGGPDLWKCTDQILSPPITGYKKIDPYPTTPDCAGDPVKAKKLLADAGFPNGITLKYVFRVKGKNPAIAATMQAELKKAGITLKLQQTPNADFYTKHLSHLPAIKSGDWDIAVPGWSPDWAGNAARSFFVPLLDGRLFAEGTTNYGGYNNPAVNALADQALAAPSADKAAELWAQVDQKTMEDAPWVPIDYGYSVRYWSKNVGGCTIFLFTDNCDIANVWKK
ncbi:MAG: peptide/nickel transport system substrate-binding protein [Actinomycetota bacterium]|jgi:peptide/nickel transport system substrate-binding protein|nr:peptide/nickel transport system substrate-binding protein [Actinomycetota bacterium]